MLEFYIVLGIAIVASLAFIFSWSEKRPLFSFWFKGVATVTVIALASVAIFVNTEMGLPALFFMIGLACCMLGDLTLALLELLDESKRENVITYGMISFGVAQVFFIIGMSMVGGFMPWAILGGVGFALLVFLLSKPMKLNFGKCLIPGLIYACALATSLFTAITFLVTSGGSTAGIILTIGFASFMISDLILSQIYFGQINKKPLYIPNLATYYAAIILIACSLLTLV